MTYYATVAVPPKTIPRSPFPRLRIQTIVPARQSAEVTSDGKISARCGTQFIVKAFLSRLIEPHTGDKIEVLFCGDASSDWFEQ